MKIVVYRKAMKYINEFFAQRTSKLLVSFTLPGLPLGFPLAWHKQLKSQNEEITPNLLVLLLCRLKRGKTNKKPPVPQLSPTSWDPVNLDARAIHNYWREKATTLGLEILSLFWLVKQIWRKKNHFLEASEQLLHPVSLPSLLILCRFIYISNVKIIRISAS